jgi:hypothetical protein
LTLVEEMSSKSEKSKSSSSSKKSSSTKRSSTKRSSTKRPSDKEAAFTVTPEVQAAIERQNAEDDAAEVERKRTVKERMAKMAGAGGQAPGFATAGIGAQIAKVTAKRVDGKRLSVKAVIAQTEKVAEKKAPRIPKPPGH